MWRRLRWVVLAVVVALVAAIVALVLVEKPKISDARDRVDKTWAPLRAPDQLVARYQKLYGALSAFDAAGGSDRAVSKDLNASLRAWQAALKSHDAATQVRQANTLEGQGARLRANILAAPRFAAESAITEALLAFTAAQPKPTLVRAYNAAVRDYEHKRSGTLSRPVARLFGYDARPEFVLGG
jgi:hypothetical protein